ncbi:MAG: hypothetical protein K0B15_12305 [Lentimicrobium sp.]|nr:hypothetical protein [Lentimicrobium sp.]
MKKTTSKLFVASLLIFLSLNAFSQNVDDFDNYSDQTENYNSNEFNGTTFFTSLIICSVLIIAGLYLRKKQDKFIKGTGTAIIVLGGLGAILFLGGPILGAISVVWKVILGIVAVAGAIYLIYSLFFE